MGPPGYESVSSDKNIYIYICEITSLTILTDGVSFRLGGWQQRETREGGNRTEKHRDPPIQSDSGNGIVVAFVPTCCVPVCMRTIANHPDHRGPPRYTGHVTSNDRIPTVSSLMIII